MRAIRTTRGTGLALLLSIPAAAAAAPACLNLDDPALALPPAAAGLPAPLVFASQLPLAADLETRYTTFGNHQGSVEAAGRGGDLWLLLPPSAELPQGCLRNLTREAGFGSDAESQGGPGAIAVREPDVHWDGDRIVFAMVVGGQPDLAPVAGYWQLYEATGLGMDEALAITRLAHQPAEYNLVSPRYGADDDWVYFTADIPRAGVDARHHYPQQDEYERLPTPTGVWRMHRGTGQLDLLDNTPSGVFAPLVDSFGRIIASRWDHLQRDIFADGAFRFADESPGAPEVPFVEVFPEPLPGEGPELHPQYGEVSGFNFKHFFLWEYAADGSGAEILNHLGRHELAFFFNRNFLAAGNGLQSFTHPGGRDTSIENMLHPEEDPDQAGRYVFTDAPHFLRQSGGRLLAVAAPPGVAADAITLENITHPRALVPDDPAFSGDRFRDPLPLPGGGLVAAFANACGAGPGCDDATRDLDPDPVRFAPNYAWRLHRLADGDADGYLDRGEPVTPAITRRVRSFGIGQGVEIVYEGPMSQLDPVLLGPRPRPPLTAASPLPAPEASVFAARQVDPGAFAAWLAERGLAAIVVRDVTTRDIADRQQPFDLRVHDSTVATETGEGTSTPVASLELVQADLVSGHPFRPGLRPLAVPMQPDVAVLNPPQRRQPGAAQRQRVSTADGSVAAIVPAERALSWQLLDPAGLPVVRERYWVTMQPGEVRVCSSCHGPNSTDQLGRPAPTHAPEALDALLRHWSEVLEPMLFDDGFE